MEVTHRQEDTVHVLTLRGKITVGKGVSGMREGIEQAVADGHQRLVLNMREIRYVDQPGISALASLYAEIGLAGVKLKIAEVPTRIFHQFKHSMLTEVIPIYGSEAEAVASF